MEQTIKNMTSQSHLDKSLIPKGHYCYETVGVEHTIEGVKITTRRCPYFEWKCVDDGLNWHEGYCNLVEDTDILLDDLTKICNENK